MDEAYIEIKSQWKYLCRAVDTAGQTIDFLLTTRRDAAAALRFFRKAIRCHGEPEVVAIIKVALKLRLWPRGTWILGIKKDVRRRYLRTSANGAEGWAA